MSVARLAFANFMSRRTRFALTIIAVALSVALVVSITSGYASVERAIRNFVSDFIGTIDFEVTTREDSQPAISPDLIQQMRSDPRVASVTTRIEAMLSPVDETGAAMLHARLMLFGVEDDIRSLGRPPRMDQGRYFEPGERDVIVIDQNELQTLGAKLGDTLAFSAGEQKMNLKIIGVIHKPAMLRMFFRSGYLPVDQLREFVAPSRPGYVSKIRGEFVPGVDSEAFAADWKIRVRQSDPRHTFTLVRDSRTELDRNLNALKLTSYFGSTIGLAAAAFIILSALMTGVQEQHRQLAMLRAIGATKVQVAKLVCIEGLCIGVTGAIVGVPVGIVGLYALSYGFPDIFDGGVALDYVGMAFAITVAAIAALLASIVPAIWASRAKPMEAMSTATTRVTSALPWTLIVIGIVLASLDSLIIFLPFESWARSLKFHSIVPHIREYRLFGHVLVGIPMMLIGALLFAPLVVWTVEFLFRNVLAIAMRLPRAMLKQQLTESPWRSAATGVAMMIGLMILITMNAQGRSALGAWKIPSRFPDIFIVPDSSYGLLPIRASEITAIRSIPEIQTDKVMALSVTAPTLGAEIFNISGANMPNQTLFIGVDPNLAFEMMELDFRVGNEQTAKRMMAAGRSIKLKNGAVVHATVENETPETLEVLTILDQKQSIPKDQIARNDRGRYLVITNEFRKLRGYTVGSTFQLEAGLFIREKVDFVIAGVVWSPGLDVMLNTFDLPSRVKEQTAATVFGTLQDGSDVFGVKDAFLLAANLKPGVDKKELMDSIRRKLGRDGLTVADVRQLKHDIESTFSNVLFFASTIAGLAMLVATLGVGNAIVAAVRTRQWRLGVLRAIGLTRGELLRMLLAEAMLLSIVGIVLGVGFGLILAINANALYAVAIGFDPPLVIPWTEIVWASVFVFVMGIVATIIPAVSTARRQPLSLLQAGRAAS